MKPKKDVTVEGQLLAEAMDADSLEDKAEKEELLIEEENNNACEMVKGAYKKLTSGHAIVRDKIVFIVILGVILFFIGGCYLIWFGINCVTEFGIKAATIVFIFSALLLTSSIGVAVFKTICIYS